MLLSRLATVFAAVTLCRAQISEYFDEKLTVTPLKDGKVASTLAFTTLLKNASPRNPERLHDDDDSQHYTLFPLALGQILREYGVTEMHLTLNAGKWNYDSWGHPVEPGVGTGAELWAWIGDGALSTVDARWKGLRNALAGLFCSSLGALDELRTTSPTEVFHPEGSLPSSTPHQLRHASHPSEHVCTENLTPFVKLLPCKASAGLATLLNPHRLFDANWHGMGVHVLWHEDEGVEVRLTFQTVSDPLRNYQARKQDWSFESLFGRKVERACPATRSSIVEVSLPQDSPYNLSPEPTLAEKEVAWFDIQRASKPVDISMSYMRDFNPGLAARLAKPSTPLSVQRTLKESSQAHGQLSVVLKNHESYPIQAVYLETMPWIVQFYLHTLTATVDGHPYSSAFSNLSYIPAVPHSRPSTFHVLLSIPANSTLKVTMDVTKAFLRYTEHPPDAQRGWDLPPAIIAPLNLDTNRMYTPTLLVDLATPDFSMPYNVIIFTCTLLAFLFGNVFNLLTRKFVVVSLKPAPSSTIKED
ncbi:GPI transamidase component GPI16 [Ephemerocybe angulata]|uniref:GPI transamidase component GPI16 n=1 Tax=Ephemerocybe angulata TaxID=980116 RepID=A0A8H6HN51_9AGAR|nr:GPI transamidase component GPI16 [Tulosesus angulatus]